MMTNVNHRTETSQQPSDYLRENKSSFDLLREKHEKEMNELYDKFQELLEEFRGNASLRKG